MMRYSNKTSKYENEVVKMVFKSEKKWCLLRINHCRTMDVFNVFPYFVAFFDLFLFIFLGIVFDLNKIF